MRKIESVEFSSALRNKLSSTRMISRDINQDVVDVILSFIDGINLLPENAEKLGNRSLSEIKIPGFLQEFILPEKVSINPVDRRSKDLLDRDAICLTNQKVGEPTPSYNEFCTACDSLFNLYKMSVPDGKNARELRKEVSLVDILPKCAFNSKDDNNLCWDGKVPFIPIPVKIDVFKDQYFNCSTETMLSEWLLGLKSKIVE